ncbi:MAG: hypothetical protein ACPHP5_04795 [Candidatus Puniceispirillaceae bacterium]
MAKMPENDNLVMESIEDLFNQADSVSITKGNVTPHLEREHIKNMPIIGAQPVSLEKDMPATESILVLAGQKRPLSDKAEPLFSVEPQIEDESPPATETPAENPESENPFLAIRQAVISAGDADSDAGRSREDKKTDDAAAPQKDSSNRGTGESVSSHGSSAKALSDRNFTDQIAQLIDNEIEVRLKAQLSIFALADHPAKAATLGEEKSKKTSPAKRTPIAKKIREPKKTAAKRTSANKKTQATKTQAPKKQATKAKTIKTQKKSLKGAAAPAAKGAKKAPLKKTTASKAVTSKKIRANKKTASLKKNAPAKKKS